MTFPQKPLYLQIAQKICEKEINNSQSLILPTLHVLCTKYQVSLKTMVRAIRHLQTQNLVKVSRGKRIQIAGKSDKEILNSSNPAHFRLYRKIKEEIIKGKYRTGQSLPKIDFYAITEKCSRHTVCSCFDLLKNDAMIYKQGKQWVVGQVKKKPDNSARIITVTKDWPVVVVISTDYRGWKTMHAQHTRPFTIELFGEFYRHAIRPVYAQTVKNYVHTYDIPTGKQEIFSYISSLGSRFRGILLAGPFNAFFSQADIEDWVKWCGQFRKPVVLFDSGNTTAFVDRKTAGSDLFFRATYNSSDIASLLLDSLVQRGHSTIAMPIPSSIEYPEWVILREKILRTALETGRWKGCTLITIPQEETFWNDNMLENDDLMNMKLTEILNLTNEANRGKSKKIIEEKFRQECLRCFPSLTAIMREKKITAVIGVNQYFAANYYMWFRVMGISIPQQLSLVSTDNRPHLERFSISTVDLKFGDLGYRTAHIFIDDIDIKADRMGTIYSKPQLIDKGSIGPPRKTSQKLVARG